MNGADLVHALRSRGITLTVVGDRLRYRPPLPPEDVAELAAHKGEVVAALRAEEEREQLRQLHAGLSAEDRARFAGEVEAGDPLATLILGLMGGTA